MFGTNAPNFASIPRPVFGRAAQHAEPGTTPARLKANARYKRQAAIAAELLPDLPEPGESVHVLMTGHFDLCQVIADIARRTKPEALRITTLCYSRRNAAELLGLLESRAEAGHPLKLTLVASDFFGQHNKELHEWFREQLAAFPTAQLVTTRSHCKVVCFDLGPADGLVFEGSANLRTNKNREQLAVIRDRGLHDWHAAWIDQLAQNGKGN